jgi:hypothetical protein
LTESEEKINILRREMTDDFLVTLFSNVARQVGASA